MQGTVPSEPFGRPRRFNGQVRAATWVAVGLSLAAPVFAEEPARHTLARATGTIVLDGDLSDPAWEQATKIDTFYETVFGDNRAPHVTTVARLMYDDRYLYIGVRCDDPAPAQIRAPYVDRDTVFGDQDNVAVFLDTRNDRRSALELRVNPRGIQADAMFNDANGNEDFSPDFYYDTAARITAGGWEAEYRIPLSSLRYPRADPQAWGVMIWRNYPRDFRYALYSSPVPRGTNCLICLAAVLEGISGLPSSSHLVLAPYLSAENVAAAPAPGAPLTDGSTDLSGGVDLKWQPSAEMAIDATVNPDFSQIEADVAQIAVNNRFALFYPEKRPFFLEGVDLFDTPIQLVYTRTITAPRFGLRTTGKLGSSSYTLLLAQDRGGGSVIVPGPTFSDLAPQDFRSVVGVARLRRDFGGSFVGLTYTGREIEGGGHNRVFGPDFQWRPTQYDQFTAQILASHTETPDGPAPGSDSGPRRLTSHAALVQWAHTARSLDLFGQFKDFGNDFRADQGFVPQVGYREGYLEGGYNLYPKGFFARLRPRVFADYVVDRDGDLVNQRLGSGIGVLGKRNLQATVNLNFDRVRTGQDVLSRTQVVLNMFFNPSRRVPRLGLSGSAGEDIDVANVRVGRGANLALEAQLRPTDHLGLDLNSALSWLDVPVGAGRRSRLFTAQVERLKATYTFGPRLFVRLIGQYIASQRDPTLYAFPVPRESGTFAGSALVSYKLNWQTAAFLGYGDNRVLDEAQDLVRSDRQVFFKISYSFQR
jgi:hypothetical protein